jgi:hypothetical protein
MERLAQDLAPDRLQAITREIKLAEAIDAGRKIVEGACAGAWWSTSTRREVALSPGDADRKLRVPGLARRDVTLQS